MIFDKKLETRFDASGILFCALTDLMSFVFLLQTSEKIESIRLSSEIVVVSFIEIETVDLFG